MKKTQFKGLDSIHLHIIAMGCMLLDHIWGMFGTSAQDWMTCIGRIAFPIYAFLIIEGYFNTRDRKKFFIRLLVLALISEIPFNLMTSGSVLNPLAQNVIWTLLIGVTLVHINEKYVSKHIVLRIIVGLITIGIAQLVGSLSLIDYHYAGLYTVLIFYFLREKSKLNLVLQLLFMVFINTEILGGYNYEIIINHTYYTFPRQGFALLALIPIWLYNGKLGECSIKFKSIYRLFYPLHMIILVIIRLL